MDIEELVIKHAIIYNSPEYTKAKALIKKLAKVQDSLREAMEEQGKTSAKAKRDGAVYRVTFAKRSSKRVDVKALPKEVRGQYTKNVEYMTLTESTVM